MADTRTLGERAVGRLLEECITDTKVGSPGKYGQALYDAIVVVVDAAYMEGFRCYDVCRDLRTLLDGDAK